MKPQAELAAGRRERSDFIATVDEPGLGRLRDRHHSRFWEMDVRATSRERADQFGCQLAIGTRRDQELRAVGEKFRRAAFVGLDMRRGGADHAMIGLAK